MNSADVSYDWVPHEWLVPRFRRRLAMGALPVRYVFVDEAGTSAKEPVTVVVGIIANADKHVMSAEALALETLGGVPQSLKDGFVFHATQVFGDRKYQADWAMTDRLRLLKDMMSIPRRIGMALTVSAVWRGAVDNTEHEKLLGLSAAQFDHFSAFNLCLCVADRNIRRHAAPNEVATVVAEDVPEMRRFLKVVPQMSREMGTYMEPRFFRKTSKDEAAGYNTQSGDLRITRIRNSVHFVQKPDDPLVQVADACAYGFRRYLAGEKFGNDFVDAILGDHRAVSHFAPPCGVACWWPGSDSPHVRD